MITAMKTVLITMVLADRYTEKGYPGIARMLKAMKPGAVVGNNAFLVRTNFTTEDIITQMKHHLTQGETVCAFTVTQPSHYYAPEIVGKMIDEVFGDESESSASVPPTSQPRY